ncbi:MAG: right-handed parallel beta-helix repeat-containing protein [Pyrinomonadaceae bacterium]|nr:right-handed parallel beta-helix repeat-containing protein [Phycisphaerales bacterium]
MTIFQAPIAAVVLLCLTLLNAGPGAAASAQPVCEALPTFDAGLFPTRELHVAPPPLGNDQSGDGSAARPFATIRHAVGNAEPGTAVRVHPGSYAGGTFISEVRGLADAPIWIGGMGSKPGQPPAARPVIEGGSDGLHLVQCSYIVIHDLEVRGASGNGINSDDGGEYANPLAAHHQVFRGLFIHDIGSSGNQDGLKLSGLRDFAVLDCEIMRCGGSMSGSGIDMVGCHGGVIARTFMHDLSANAVQAKGGSTDVLITRCRMENAGERALNIGGSTGFKFFRPPLSETAPNAEARNIRAVANIIVGSNAAFAFVGATDCLVAHNTVIEPRRWIFRILQETTSSPPYVFDPCSNNSVSSNLVYFRRGALSTHLNIGANTSPATFVFRHNLWYAFDNPAASMPVLPSPEMGGIAGVDPMLRDAPGGNYAICGMSPAAGRGVSPAPVPGDYLGVCYRDPPSIGSLEIPERPAGDFNKDGTLDTRDFFEFLSAFFTVQPAGDFNADGVINSQDFFDFVAAFATGC